MNIVSNLIPAVGWTALYVNDGYSGVARPLVCWVNELKPGFGPGEFKPTITGMVVDELGEIVPAPTLDGFKTYEYDLDGASVDFLALKNGNG